MITTKRRRGAGKWAALGASAALALGGCDDGASTADATPLDQKVKAVPAAPAPGQGKQFVGPKVIVPKGQERMTCWVPDWTADQDYQIQRFIGLQGSMGHHVVALQAEPGYYKPGEVFDCTSLAQMVNLKPLVLPDPHGKELLPTGYTVKLPKGVPIVIQSHYVNYADRDIEIQDVARFEFAAKTDKEVSYLIINDGLIKVEPGKTATRKTTCVIPKDMTLLLSLGHMHEWGTKIDTQLERPSDPSANRSLYAVDKWQVEYRDEPPVEEYGLAKAVQLKAGDKVTVSCTWNNTTAKELKFPHEMCTSVSYYYPALPEGMVLCEAE